MPLKSLGGGGYNSLKEKENDDNPQSDDDTGDSGESEVTTYTYKSYLDYFIDNMDCTGVYDTDGNLTNVTMSAEKKAEILSYDFTGSGTASDPYQINTTDGFWYMSKFVNLTNKYIELNCDVILNDEKFDENGSASGGDGVVYSWSAIGSGASSVINGNKNAIKGLYYNNPDKKYFSIFSYSQVVDKIINLNLDNFFIKTDSFSAGIVLMVNEIENCHAGKGCINAPNGPCSGIAYTVNKKLTNCSNSFKINGGNHSSGLVVFVKNNVIINNAINYGDVTGAWSAAGIIANPAVEYLQIRNSQNYGNVKGNIHVGGIIGRLVVSKGSCDIINCQNYGNIDGGSDICAGVVAYASGVWSMVNCANFGAVASTGAKGLLFCNISADYSNEKTIINIVDCYVKTNLTCSVVYGTSGNTANVELNIDGLEVEIKTDSNIIYRLIIMYSNKAVVLLNDVVMNVQCEAFGGSISNNIHSASNVILNVKCNSFYYYGGNLSFLVNGFAEKLTSVLISIVSLDNTRKIYYGSNFRDFYVSWKYGTIGLKTLDGIGSAQGSITIAWLEENGWIKMG